MQPPLQKQFTLNFPPKTTQKKVIYNERSTGSNAKTKKPKSGAHRLTKKSQFSSMREGHQLRWRGNIPHAYAQPELHTWGARPKIYTVFNGKLKQIIQPRRLQTGRLTAKIAPLAPPSMDKSSTKSKKKSYNVDLWPNDAGLCYALFEFEFCLRARGTSRIRPTVCFRYKILSKIGDGEPMRVAVSA